MNSCRLLRVWILSLLCGFSCLASTTWAVVAPTNCQAVAISGNAGTGATVINVYWNDNSNDETSFRIEVSADANPAFSFVANVATNSTGFQWISGLTNHTYRFRVFANNTGVFSTASNVATVGTSDLGAPFNLRGTAVDSFNASFVWEEASYAEAGFSVESRVPSGTWAILGAVGANGGLNITPSQLISANAIFDFRIRAFKGSPPTTPDSPVNANVSAYSNIVSLTGPAYVLTATPVACQYKVNLSWPNVLGEDGYHIFRRGPTDADFSFVAAVLPNVTTFQVTGRADTPGSAFSYLVRPWAGPNYFGVSTTPAVTMDDITSKSGTSGTPGSSFLHPFTHFANGPTGTITSRTLTNKPASLTFDAATGQLTGTYPPLGNYTLVYTVNFSTGCSLTQTFYIRVRPSAGPPAIAATFPNWTTTAGTTRDTPLAGKFTDAEAESAVRVSTTLGDMDFILFDTATPTTVTNFKNYLTRYADVVFHRSVGGFVIQGGGFKGTGVGSNFTSVPQDAQLINEPGVANLRGTVSMAKLGGDPNSATNQFFVSLADNRSNLDFQNGGFTVFGRVAGNGMTVADAISFLPTRTYSLFLDGSSQSSAFGGFPMNTPSPAPDIMDQTKVVKIISATLIPTMTYSIAGNTNPTAVSASIVSGQLHLAALAGGTGTVNVIATDLDNLASPLQAISFTVTDTFATWAARQTFAGGQNASTQNPDGDDLNNLLEYGFLGNPDVSSTTETPVAGKVGTAPAAEYLTLTFPVRKFTTGLSYTVETSASLTGVWTPVWTSADGFGHARVTAATDLTDRTQVTIKDSVAISSPGKRFIRARVTQD